MKIFLLYLLFGFLLSFSLKAQDKTYTQTIDSLFINLNKTEITTGILYDRVYPFAALEKFNLGASDTASNRYFTQAYLELFTAAYNNSGMTNPDALEGFKKTQIYDGIVPIGLLNYNYNLMDTLAQNNNLISVSGLTLYDVAGRSQSPYLLKNTTVAAILADTVNSSSVNFQLYSATFLQNTSLGIQNLQVDFGDGTGLHTINVDQSISINYSTGGSKIIKFIITYTNGQQVVTYSEIYIKSDNSYARSGPVPNSATCNGIEHPQTLDIIANIAYQGYEESSALKGQGKVTIFYHDNDCDRVLKKPIIIIDGFDPGSQRLAGDIFKLLKYDNGITNNANLGQELINKGYDVIILDFLAYPAGGKMIDGGSDYIQRNAFTLIKLIDTINVMKASSADDLIVVGPSMGGLISRYALTYMESHNMPHHTKLWVSFDAPQLGANIPIGDQWMLKYLAVDFGNGDAKKKLDDKINTAAAKEMILHHYLSGQQSPTPHFTRNLFVQELNNLGYPVGDAGHPIRNISLANGSGNGTLKNNFGGLALQFSELPTTGARIVGGVLTYLFPHRLILNIIATILGVGLNSSVITTNVWFTSGYNSNNKVFEGSIFNGFLVRKSYYSSTPSNSIGLDNASGGLYDTQQQIKDGLSDALNHGFKRLIYKPVFSAFIPDHSFIPVKSSLAVTTVSNFGDDYSTRNLVNTGETPFNSYFTPDLNEGHVTLTDCSAKWLTKEIDGQPQAPVGIKYTITGGSQTICSSDVYSISPAISGGAITWSASPSNIVSLTPSGNSVTVTRISDGTVTLNAAISGLNCSTILPKTLNIGPPSAAPIYGPTNGCTGDPDSYTFSAPDLAGATNWNWSTFPTSTFISSSGTSLATIGFNNPGNYGIECDITTPCGIVQTFGTFSASDCGRSSGFVAYPNPAANNMTISTSSASTTTSTTNSTGATSNTKRSFSYKIYNKIGKVLKQGSSKGEDAIVDTRDLSSGNYFLHVFIGKEEIQKQIVIQH